MRSDPLTAIDTATRHQQQLRNLAMFWELRVQVDVIVTQTGIVYRVCVGPDSVLFSGLTDTHNALQLLHIAKEHEHA